MLLGNVVNCIRSDGSFADQREDLTSMGFDYSVRKRASYPYTVVESALLRYKEKYGDMRVERSFVVPIDDESWPEESRGMTLGLTVNGIRSGRSYADQKEELISIGFDYSSQRIAHGFNVVRSALLRYQDDYGDMIVERSFIIPTDDETWPEETWGIKLGNAVHSIRTGRGYKDKREELISLGFDYTPLSTASAAQG
jgi:hypothetical protein